MERMLLASKRSPTFTPYIHQIGIEEAGKRLEEAPQTRPDGVGAPDVSAGEVGAMPARAAVMKVVK